MRFDISIKHEGTKDAKMMARNHLEASSV